MRATPLLALPLLLSALAALPTPAGAQTASLAETTDPAGDVVLLADGAPTEAGIPQDSTLTNYVDMRAVRVTEETNKDFTMEMQLGSLVKDPDTRTVGQIVDLFTCFTYSANGQSYRLWTSLNHWTTVFDTRSRPILLISLLDSVEGCPHLNPFHSYIRRASPDEVRTELDPATGTVRLRVERAAFGGESLNPDPEDAIRPRPGDVFSDIHTVAVTRVGGGTVGVPAASVRTYLWYDDTPTFDFTFTKLSGNSELQLVVTRNIYRLPGLTEPTVPAYGVDVGGFQTIPLDVFNHLAEAVTVHLNVSVQEGDASKWSAKIIPTIPLPAATELGPGNITVTLLVRADPTISHKDRVRVLVEGTIPGREDVLGAASVDVIGVVPPSVQSPRFWFHAVGRPCQPGGYQWMNTLETDPQGPNRELPFVECSAGGGGVQSGTLAWQFRSDVSLNRHYTLDITRTGVAHVAFKSSVWYNVLNQQPVEVPVPAIGDVVANLYSGDVLIGTGRVESIQISDGTNFVDVPFKVFPEHRLASDRYVPNEKPLNLEFIVNLAEREFIIGNDQVGHYRQTVPTTSAQMKMMLNGAYADLPILHAVYSGNRIQTTPNGTLVTITTKDDAQAFMNPAKHKVFNLTVRNEGINPDTVRVSVAVNQTGWDVKILPKREFFLQPGEAAWFLVQVRVPEEALEEQAALLEVTARSVNDPGAESTVALTLKATRGTIFTDEVSGVVEIVEKAKKSPAPIFATLVALLAVAVGGRRRRDAAGA